MAAAAQVEGAKAGWVRAVLARASSLGRLERAALAVLATRIGAAGCAYIAQVLMARLMGGSEYGVFATVWVWIAILGHASTWGFGQAASRYLPAYRARGEFGAARGYLAVGALVALGSGLVVALAGVAVLPLIGARLGAEAVAPVLLALLVIPVFALQDFAEGVARALDWPLLAVAPPYLLRQALVMGGMASAIFAGAPADAWVAVAATLAATALALAVQGALLLGRLVEALPAGILALRWREWRRAAFPIALVDLAGSGFTFADVLALGLVMPPAAVGAYFAATRVQQFVVFVQFAASAATVQHFASAQAHGDRVGLQALVRRRARLATLATAATGVLVLAASPLLLGLFGPDFGAGIPALAVLIAGAVLQSALGPADDVLTMLGGERVCAAVSLAAVAVAVLLVVALAPVLGLVGAALAMVLAGLGRALILARLAQSRLGVATPILAWPGARP